MKEPNDQSELLSKQERCKVCHDAAFERTFGFPICDSCKMFVFQCLRSETTHKPCKRNKKCINDFRTIKECSCCLLRKCVNLRLDPYYETRQEIDNALRRSFPYHPCRTCTSNISLVSEELNRVDYKNTPDNGFQIHSDKKRHDTLTASSSLPYPLCKVCGDKARGFRYSVLSCDRCAQFFHDQVLSKKTHKPCSGKQCIITGKKRFACRCCRLKKCLAVGMDPVMIKNIMEIKSDSIIKYDPMEWFVLLSCETCDFKEMDIINRSIQDLKSFFMKIKEKSTISSAVSNKEVTEDTIQRQLRNDKENCLKPLDFHPQRIPPSDIGDPLNETNISPSGPTLFSRDGHISYSCIYSGSSGRFPNFASSQSATTVENHDAISFEEGLLASFVESGSSSFGSHFVVLNDNRLNFSSTFTSSSSPSPDVGKGWIW